MPELGIDGLISYNKGCYIGQEIIARIHFRGHIAKRLSGLEGQFTMSLSAAAKQALMLEMAALLANLSGSDLDKLPPVDSTPAGASQ